MGAMLDSQIESFEHSLDAVKNGHQPTLEQLSEAISVGVGLFRTLVAEVQAFNAAPQTEPRAVMLEKAREYHRRYQRLADRLEHLADLIKPLRDRGLPVRGSEKLDEACFELRSILMFHPDELEKAYADIRAGRGIPLSQVRDEIRRRLRA